MNIVGIGTDLVNVERIGDLYQKNTEGFLQKILSPQEIQAFQQISPQRQRSYLAKRFAAKEAIAKALGQGIGKISFRDITISNNSQGAPIATINGKHSIESRYVINISLSDEPPFALAFAVIVNNI